MPVTRYRRVEDMPPPWRDADDPSNLREVARMMALYRQLRGSEPVPAARVQKFRTPEEANAARNDPYRQDDQRMLPGKKAGRVTMRDGAP